MDRDAARPGKSRSSAEMSAHGRVVVPAGNARKIDGDSLPAGLGLKQIPRRAGGPWALTPWLAIRPLLGEHDKSTLENKEFAGEH